jgi:hypothetical protein
MMMDQWLGMFSALVSFTGLIAVAIQMRAATKQRRFEAMDQIYDINRQLLSLGFSHPQLFGVLADAKPADPVSEKHYLQMWLNQLALIHSHLKHGGFDAEFQDSLERDIGYFMELGNMQRHWKAFSEFYPKSFRTLVNGILEEMERSKQATEEL